MIWLVAAALAADPKGDVTGEARAILTLPADFALDADGRMAEWGPALDTRLRLGAHGAWGKVRGAVETDVLSGLLVGDTWSLSPLDERDRHVLDALSADGITPRKLLLGARLPWFDLEAGLTTSQWGLGMVANAGATDPVFGRTDFGDRVLRARLATAPLQGGEYPLYVLVAGDRVVADDLARLSDGDVAWQAVAAVLYAKGGLEVTEDVRHLGVYGAWRDQVRSDGRILRAGVLDAYGDWTFDAGGRQVRLAGEAALLTGRTDVARTYLGPEALAIRQGGATARAALSGERVSWELRGAWASGDASTDDAVVGDFRFDRDLDVGMVLFDEIASRVDLAALEASSDPTLGARPPDGIQTLAAEGAFHAAIAVQPVVSVAPARWLDLSAGAVAAWSTQPIADPLRTFRAGGTARNRLGDAPDGRYLGSELDWAVDLHATAEGWLALPSLEVQGGHAWASAAYGRTGRVDHVMVIGRLRR